METLSAGDPQHVGPYWLAGRLGSGGQGVVYEAYDPEGHRVALKMLHPAGNGMAGRLAKEATAARRVASFCTAKVLAADLDGSRPYIVSEYVPGPSLRQAVTEGRRFTGDDLHRLATAVATALTAIHDAGVIHRDLKPDNVLLGPDGPRVIDFGIARTLDMSLTGTGEVAGTPSYLAPEVFAGQRAGAPADVFAWGATMVFATTGQDPFHADNLGGVMHRVLSHHPDLSALPSGLAPLVGAALRKEPAARPAARDLLLALVSGDCADLGGLLAEGSRAAGGVAAPGRADPALGTIAEDAYGSLGPEERDLAAEVFLRLVAIGEDGRETGRAASHDELFEGRPEREAEAVRRVLRAFSYVVSTDGHSVELARPALLRAWPRLRMWVNADRDGLAVLGEINRAARHWAEHGRRDADLLQGSRLEQALRWAATSRRHVTLTPRERDYLQAGTDLTRRRIRRRRLTVVALAGMLAVALAAGGVAVWQGRQTARQRDVAVARQAAAEADRLRTVDPVTAMRLSVAAWRLSPQPEARSSLMASLQQQETAVFRDPPVQGLAYRALSRDGRTMVSVSKQGVNVYDVRTGRRTGGWKGLGLKGEIVFAPVLSPSGRLLAQSTPEELGVWDLSTGRRVYEEKLEQASGGGYFPRFGEHETTLLVGYWEGLSHLVDLKTGKRFGRPVDRADGTEATPDDLLVDPTGRRMLVMQGKLGALSLPAWRRQGPYPACGRQSTVAAFSPDGRTLACAGDEIRLVDAASGQVRVKDDEWTCDLCGKALPGLRLDDRHVAVFSRRDLQVWRIADHREVLSYRAEGDLADVRLDPDGRTLRYLMDDVVVSVDLGPRVTSTRVSKDAEIRLGPRGRWATVADYEATRVKLMDLRTHRNVATFAKGSEESVVPGFDEPGGRLVLAGPESKVRLIDLRTSRQVWAVRTPKYNLPEQVQFSPDGTKVVMSMGPEGQSGPFRVMVYDAATGRTLHNYRTTVRGGPLTRDGTTLVTGSGTYLDLTTGRLAGTGFDLSAGGYSPALSSKGVIAIGQDEDGRIALWRFDPRGPTPIRPALPRAAGSVVLLAFSPDGSVLATLAGNGKLQLWDPAGKRRLGGSFDLHTFQMPDALTFSADGRTVYAAVDGTIHQVPVEPGQVAADVCRRAGGGLSERDWSAHLPEVPYRETC
ncbi:WD40 repeat domain-containing serine/threonine protein kinase [Nonomuraea rhodomycinica]|uniref:Protein kinase n=1 Tax=Nonomuraea rhodomycinica TaxID=1712872 RepID=A0A7Y6IRY4_9ACTN|nr:WD40 repeat domain-containing serine/threonine protein kinase [Nonomuraea rhodomycinica]NUW43015.1 protein kinase [Nonomuraea rhodomycinica]